MGNESEFFGLAAVLRGWTHPLNRKYPWLRYLLAIVSIGVFWVVVRIIGDWSWIAVICWLLIGLLWFQVFSRCRDFWWGRKHGKTIFTDVLHELAAIVLLSVGAFTWPLWMAFGEDMFN